MGRWVDLESDEHRLPEGMRRVGYDADTQRYTYQDADGSLWEGGEGNRYGHLERAGTHSSLTQSSLSAREVLAQRAGLDSPTTATALKPGTIARLFRRWSEKIRPSSKTNIPESEGKENATTKAAKASDASQSSSDPKETRSTKEKMPAQEDQAFLDHEDIRLLREKQDEESSSCEQRKSELFAVKTNEGKERTKEDGAHTNESEPKESSSPTRKQE